MRAYELRQHDVISYYPPQPHKQEYKLGEHISIDELAEAMFNSPASAAASARFKYSSPKRITGHG